MYRKTAEKTCFEAKNQELRTKTRIITKIDYEKIEYSFGCS
jgi:hypothetical protein